MSRKGSARRVSPVLPDASCGLGHVYGAGLTSARSIVGIGLAASGRAPLCEGSGSGVTTGGSFVGAPLGVAVAVGCIVTEGIGSDAPQPPKNIAARITRKTAAGSYFHFIMVFPSFSRIVFAGKRKYMHKKAQAVLSPPVL